MSDKPEKIGADVWIAATIYVDARSEEEAAQIVAARYAGTRENPDTYNHMNGEDLPLNGDDFMSSTITLYGLCNKSALVASTDDVPHMLHALKTAESFISGFEGDELQEGIDEMLATIRAAIAGTPADPVRDAAHELLGIVKECAECWPVEGIPRGGGHLPYAVMAHRIHAAIAKAEGRAHG